MGKLVLYINACVRKESRTERLAEKLLGKLGQPYEEVKLCELDFPCVDEAYLDLRNELISRGEFEHPMFELARRFAEAEMIVIAAPFWDLSFPSSLKVFIEHIMVSGLTFNYTPEGEPIPSCNADRIIYVATAGGPVYSNEYSFGYICHLAETFWQIPHRMYFCAEGLDIVGADVEGIMENTKEKIREALAGERDEG